MKKCLNSLFLSLLFCFGLFMGFGSSDVFASTGILQPVLGNIHLGSFVDHDGTSKDISLTCDSSDVFGLSIQSIVTYDTTYYQNYIFLVSDKSFEASVIVDSTYSDGNTNHSVENYPNRTFVYNGRTFYYRYYSPLLLDTSLYSSNISYSLLTYEYTGSSFSTADIESFIKAYYFGEPLEVDGGFIMSLSYDSSLGYVKNIKCDNQTTTFTNGGKDWTNVISYDRFTSTDFDLLTQGAKVQYFFQYDGSYGSNFGLGSPITMDTYLSDSFSSEGLSFSYNSTLWKELYDNWCSANNLGSTDRVKNAYLTLWLRPVYDNKYGDWVKVKEDGSSYLITSSQPFEGTELPNDANTSIGGQSNVSNTQNGNSVNSWEQIGSGDIDYSEIQKSVKGLSSLIGDIPGMISTLFSWLPNWVITFLASCIALWGVIALIKLLRG